MFCQICWRTCRVLPLFSLFFLGIGIFRTSIGMCLWWLACSAEFLPSIFPKAAFSLAGPAEVSLAEHTSLTPSSSRLTLAPGSAATDALLGRFASCPFGPKLSSIVVYSDKLSPVSPTATLLDSVCPRATDDTVATCEVRRAANQTQPAPCCSNDASCERSSSSFRCNLQPLNKMVL